MSTQIPFFILDKESKIIIIALKIPPMCYTQVCVLSFFDGSSSNSIPPEQLDSVFAMYTVMTASNTVSCTLTELLYDSIQSVRTTFSQMQIVASTHSRSNQATLLSRCCCTTKGGSNSSVHVMGTTFLPKITQCNASPLMNVKTKHVNC